MTVTNSLVGGILLAIIIMVGNQIVQSVFMKKKYGPLPPGPKGLPLIGNLLDLPTNGQREWEHWLKLKDTYGPISSISAMGQTIVLLHDPELATELFDKRSSIYSSRPPSEFARITGWNPILSVQPYDRTFRHHRKIIHTTVGTQRIIEPYQPLQEVEVRRFLFRNLTKPEDFKGHIKTLTSAIMLKMVYGYTVDKEKPDPLVHDVDVAVEQFSATFVPGSWLVDVIPALKYVPDWMPGTKWKETAREFQVNKDAVLQKPLQFARRRMAAGGTDQFFVKSFYADRGNTLSEEDEYALKWAGLTMYAGGADTTAITLLSFFLAMSLFPEVQKRGREEIDRVVGGGRLPTYDDRPSLPYIEAILKEAWRWHPVVPSGVPHTATKDDIVRGYHIPKDAIVMANAWWLLHDPAVYPDPFTFDPTRYLGRNPAPDPAEYAFGWGRRICPGRYLAASTAWLAIAQSLAALEISRPVGESKPPTLEPLPGVISRVKDFNAVVTPRSPAHEALIREVEVLHPWEKSSADELE